MEFVMLGKKDALNREGILEAGKSTWGEGGAVGKAEPKRSTI